MGAAVNTQNLKILNAFELQLMGAIRSAKDGGARFDALVWFDENFDRIKKSFDTSDDEKDAQGNN